MRPAMIWLACFVGLGVAMGQQDQIRWQTDPKPAVNEAQKTLRPLMVYVLAGSQYRDDKLERDQKRALSDPRVVHVAERFIPLKLSRSQHHDVLQQFGLSESANMEMSFVTSDGVTLGAPLSAGGVANADSLVQKMKLVLQEYGKKLYESHVGPVLTKEDAKPEELRNSLKIVQEFQLTAAVPPISDLLGQEKLDASVRTAALETLAVLSTKEAIAKLRPLVQAGDASARKALEKCTPVGAELLLADVQADADPFDYFTYKTATQVICKVQSIKAATFFEKGSARLKQDELERVRKLVAAEAERWRKRNAEDR